MELNTDWKQFVESLNSNGVEYILVGALAVAHHAIPRNTGDIDFFIRRDQENAQKIVKAIEEFGFGSLNLKSEERVNLVVSSLRSPSISETVACAPSLWLQPTV